MDNSSRSISQPELLENLVWVQALARRLVSEPSAAEDVVQDTWVVALEHPPRRTTGAGLRAWLSRVTRTMARKYRGQEALQDRRVRAASGEDLEPSTFDVVTRVAQQKRIIEAVMDLDEPDRTTVFLRYVDGLDARAIAERRGETPAAVRQRLSRALAKLRGRLEHEFDEEEGGWVRALTPLVLAGGRNATTVDWAAMLGGAIVSKTTISIGVGMAAMVLGAAWLQWADDPVAPAGPGAVAPEAGTPLVAVEQGVPGEEALASPAIEIAEPTREAVPVEVILPGAVYALRDPAGQAVSDAKLFLCRNGEVLARGLTNEGGELATDVRGEGLAQLLVQAPGVGPLLREVTLEPVRHVIQLEEGAVVSGWIVVDGKRPSERIPLRLRATHDLLPMEEELGFTLEDVGIARMAALVTDSRAGDDGSFRFYGLPDDWSGSLDLPNDYHVADPLLVQDYSRFVLPIPAPVQGLRVDVTKRRALTGRIIELPKREPVAVPGAWINPALEYAGIDRAQYQGMVKTDEEGRFRIAALASAIEGGSLVISPPGREFYVQVPVAPCELQGDLDLGDLALRARSDTGTIRLRVQDTGGAPVEGAVAATDESSPYSAPTGVDGRTSLSTVVPGLSTFAVYAKGYQVVEVPVPAEPPEELVVTLPRGTLLEVEFRKPNGELAPRLAVRLVASAHPYRDEGRLRSYKAYTRSGSSFPLAGHSDGPDVVVRLSVLDGRAVLSDLEPGLPLHLRIHGPFGTLLQEQDIAPLLPEEHRRLEVVLTRAPRTLRGRILDEAGEPLPRASVGVSYRQPDRPTVSSTLSRSVGKDGGFEITGIYSDTVAFFARADDRVKFQDDEFAIPEDGSPVEIRLAPAHVVMVVIEDEARRGVPGKVYADLPSGNTLYGTEEEGQVGSYIVRGLPSSEVTIRVRVHGVFYVRRHDPLVPELRILVPRLGQVEATIRRFGDVELDEWCHLWLFPRGDSALVPRFGMTDLNRSGPAIVPDVLPGAYDLTVRRFLQGDYPPDARFEELDASFFEELAPRVPIEVHAEATTRVEIQL